MKVAIAKGLGVRAFTGLIAAGALLAAGAASASAQQFAAGVQFGAPGFGVAVSSAAPAYVAPAPVVVRPFGYAVVDPYRDARLRFEEREAMERREHFAQERMERDRRFERRDWR